MNVTYYHKNIDSLGDASRQYIEERLETLNRIKAVDSVRVEVDKIKSGDFHMSVQANSGREVFYADATAGTVNASIDEIQDELQVQMRRKKKRIRDLMKRGARSLKKKLTIHEDARLK